MSERDLAFRTWNVRQEGDDLVLESPPCEVHRWTEGLNVPGDTEHMPMNEQISVPSGKKGFYSLKTPDFMVERHAYPRKGELPGALVPEEILGEGQFGIVSRGATVAHLMSGGEICDVCNKEQASTLLSYGKQNSPMIFACKDCTKRIQQVLSRKKTSVGVPIDEVVDRIAQRYRIEVMPMPSVLVAARRKYRNKI